MGCYPIQAFVLWLECIIINEKLSLNPISDTSSNIQEGWTCINPARLHFMWVSSCRATSGLSVQITQCFMLVGISHLGSSICKTKTSIKLDPSSFFESSVSSNIWFEDEA